MTCEPLVPAPVLAAFADRFYERCVVWCRGEWGGKWHRARISDRYYDKSRGAKLIPVDHVGRDIAEHSLIFRNRHYAWEIAERQFSNRSILGFTGTRNDIVRQTIPDRSFECERHYILRVAVLPFQLTPKRAGLVRVKRRWRTFTGWATPKRESPKTLPREKRTSLELEVLDIRRQVIEFDVEHRLTPVTQEAAVCRAAMIDRLVRLRNLLDG